MDIFLDWRWWLIKNIYNTIWDKVSAYIKKDFDIIGFPVYSKFFFSKIKEKPWVDEVTDFYNKQIANVYSHHSFLAVIILDSALMKDDNYYPQVFLKECKYIEEKVIRHINGNLSDFSSSDETDEE